MKSNVYFIDFRVTDRENIYQKIERLLNTAGFEKKIEEKDLTAIKLHFGEMGNTAYIRPVFIRKIVDEVKKHGGVPFLTDTNTLYAGTRSDAQSHLKTAVHNGFAYSVVNAPLVIADGLRGGSETAVPIKQKHFKKVYIGNEIYNADALISVAHFKGHELTGFGGALKNLGMGCASRKGKLAQHSTVSPQIKQKKCMACGACISHCASNAIAFKNKKAAINQKKCVGCGECIIICPNDAIQIKWNQEIPVFLENMVEYSFGAITGKKEKTFFINFVNRVSPACDCYGFSDSPIVRDIGILASDDPVAIDQACADLVNQEEALPGTCLEKNKKEGQDKFKGLYPEVDWNIQLDYAEKIGMGQRSYHLEIMETLSWGK